MIKVFKRVLDNQSYFKFSDIKKMMNPIAEHANTMLMPSMLRKVVVTFDDSSASFCTATNTSRDIQINIGVGMIKRIVEETPELKDSALMMLEGLVWHEFGHLIHTDFRAIEQMFRGYNHSHLKKAMVNMVSDYVNESDPVIKQTIKDGVMEIWKEIFYMNKRLKLQNSLEDGYIEARMSKVSVRARNSIAMLRAAASEATFNFLKENASYIKPVDPSLFVDNVGAELLMSSTYTNLNYKYNHLLLDGYVNHGHKYITLGEASEAILLTQFIRFKATSTFEVVAATEEIAKTVYGKLDWLSIGQTEFQNMFDQMCDNYERLSDFLDGEQSLVDNSPFPSLPLGEMPKEDVYIPPHISVDNSGSGGSNENLFIPDDLMDKMIDKAKEEEDKMNKESGDDEESEDTPGSHSESESGDSEDSKESGDDSGESSEGSKEGEGSDGESSDEKDSNSSNSEDSNEDKGKGSESEDSDSEGSGDDSSEDGSSEGEGSSEKEDDSSKSGEGESQESGRGKLSDEELSELAKSNAKNSIEEDKLNKEAIDSDIKQNVKRQQEALKRLKEKSEEDMIKNSTKDVKKDLNKGNQPGYENTDYIKNSQHDGIDVEYIDLNEVSSTERGNPATLGKINELNEQARRIAAPLRKILYEDSKSRQEYNLRSGSEINVMALSNPNNTRIFEKRNRGKKTGSKIALLIDESGSMYSTPMKHASEAAYLVSKTLQSIRIPFQVWGHSTNWDGVIIDKAISFKDWNKPDVLDNIWKFEAGGANHDSIPIAFSLMELAANSKPGDDMILIVLSDGAPAGINGYHGSGAEEDIRKICDDYEKAYGIKTIGVGFSTGAKTVPRIYKNYITLEDTALLGDELIKLLRSIIM